MSVLAIEKLNYSIGVESILTDITFNINKGDKVGIVGINGAGKSTLLKLIAGEYEADSGQISIARGTTMGYLKQREHFAPELNVLQVMNTLDEESQKRFEETHGYSYDRAIVGILNSMGFDASYYDKKTDVLSGGEKTRLALCVLLVKEPDILLLDEPTNHLDIPTLRWLENYLKAYKGTLIMVSHDRYFLDSTVNRIFEIENKKLVCYNGNYTQFKEQKQINYEIALKHYEHQAEEIARQEEIIRRFKEHNTEHLVKRAQSREKRLAQVERLEKPTLFNEKLKIRFEQNLVSGNDVVRANNLSFGYSKDAPLFKDVELDIKKNDRICIVGSNGIGKTTLLKIITGALLPNTSRVVLGTNVIPGYYDQEQKNLNPNKTVLDEIHSEYIKYNSEDLRKILGGFLFHGDDVFKKVSDLAGGEKARLSLLKLMMSGCNLLIFDEPTNHLDIAAKEVFEDAIAGFPGTVIIVSHDRYLLQKLPTEILELTPDGIIKYLGNYDYYVEHCTERRAGAGKKNEGTGAFGVNSDGGSGAGTGEAYACGMSDAPAKESWEQKKARDRAEQKKARELEKAEALVAKLEAEIAEIEEEIAKPEHSSNAGKLAALAADLDSKRAELDEAMEKWMELA